VKSVTDDRANLKDFFIYENNNSNNHIMLFTDNNNIVIIIISIIVIFTKRPEMTYVTHCLNYNSNNIRSSSS